MLTATTIKRLDTLGELSKAGKRINGLFRLLEDPIMWKQAYVNLHANKGATTPGIDGSSLDGFSEIKMQMLMKHLKEGTYRFKPVRRVYIAKANGKKRPLGIPTGDAKLVQEVVRMILEKIYEPIFKESSHAFRPGKSCHTALESIKRQWTGVKWIVDMDIKSFFDNIHHDVLLNILKKKIDDVRFIQLIRNMLTAGYVEDWKFHITYSGTPQGGIASPILSNIYLHELDNLMDESQIQFNRGKCRADNQKYQYYKTRIKRLRRKIDCLKHSSEQTERVKAIQSEIKILDKQYKLLPSKNAFDENYKRLLYCRYADDFRIGIIGSKQEAKQVMDKVNNFIEDYLQLEIAAEKSGIYHARAGADFLGYRMKTYSGERKVKLKQGGRYITKRTMRECMQLDIPEKKLRDFCRNKRYGNYTMFKALHKGEFQDLSDAEIIVAYNAELRGFVNYYGLAVQVGKTLGKLRTIWRMSLLKTLALKHKTKVSKIIRQLKTPQGEMLTVRTKTKQYTFKLFRMCDRKMALNSYAAVDQIANSWKFTLSRSEIIQQWEARRCEYCDKDKGPFEIHHIRKLKDVMQGKKLWQIVMARRLRKTMVLCLPCHQALHAGCLPDLKHQVINRGKAG